MINREHWLSNIFVRYEVVGGIRECERIVYSRTVKGTGWSTPTERSLAGKGNTGAWQEQHTWTCRWDSLTSSCTTFLSS